MKSRKIIKIGNSYAAIIPKDIVRGFGWDENTRINYKITRRETIEISRAESRME